VSSIAASSYTQKARMLEQGVEAISAAGPAVHGEPHRQALIISYAFYGPQAAPGPQEQRGLRPRSSP
jgi:hypothetical protein